MQNQISISQGNRGKAVKELRSPTRKYFLPEGASVLFEAAVLQMPKSLNLTIVVALGCILAGCADQSVVQKPLAAIEAANSHLGRMPNVRTTAYTRVEKGGRRNALGTYLSGRHVISASGCPAVTGCSRASSSPAITRSGRSSRCRSSSV